MFKNSLSKCLYDVYKKPPLNSSAVYVKPLSATQQPNGLSGNNSDNWNTEINAAFRYFGALHSGTIGFLIFRSSYNTVLLQDQRQRSVALTNASFIDRDTFIDCSTPKDEIIKQLDNTNKCTLPFTNCLAEPSSSSVVRSILRRYPGIFI